MIKKNIIKRKVYKSVEELQADLTSTWNERFDFYKNKYPNLDYELEFATMLEWIEDHYNKAKMRHAWNLFIQNWLSRARPAWKSYAGKPSVTETEEAKFCKQIIIANPHDMYLSIYENKLKDYEKKYGELED